MSIIKTLSIGLESFPISRLVLVLDLTEIPNQDKPWYWCQTNFYFKTSLEIDLKSRQVLVLNKISGLAELWLVAKGACQKKLEFLG